MNLCADQSPEWVTFAEVVESAGISTSEGRTDLSMLTRRLEEEFDGRNNWPVEYRERPRFRYRLQPDRARAWHKATVGGQSGSTGDESFEGLVGALRRWGKYDRHIEKMEKAVQVYDRLVRQLGPPQQVVLQEAGRYVRVIWDLQSRVFYCHATFMSWDSQLEDSWVPGVTPGRWEYRFPDFALVSRSRTKAGPATVQCPCMPGIMQLVGEPCQFCDELIRPTTP